MAPNYVVLGCGRLGIAAAYDLAAFGEAGEVVLADADLARAKEAAAQVQRLLKGKKAKVKAVAADPAKKGDLAKAVKGADGVLCALPGDAAPSAAAAALAAKAHYTDVGSGLESARAILKLKPAAIKAGVSMIPDCGLAPGLSSSLAMIAMTTLDFCREVRVYAGALPQHPAGPLEYATVYSVESLLSLYLQPGLALRRGQVETVAAMSDREELEFSGVGRLEAAVTGGSASTCPYSFQNRLVAFEQKTLRYPGHFEKMAAMQAMGFLSEKPVQIDGGKIAPRELFLALAEKAWGRQEEKDMVVLRVTARGKKLGRPTEAAYELVDRFDPATKLSAVERSSAFPAAAALALQVKGKVKPGAEPPEIALPHREFIGEIRKRGLKILESLRTVDSA
ncbi:MAG: saccharopine dehydrogenase NADP-binding domain-containing protein [Elusimicrobia bacterium]|nr:saccharopine dehydrogenase NADP-binding domain-containing protein [Elusimicrobiota bacterium]